MQSKYKSKCKVCGLDILPGDIIYKFNNHWCKNEICAKGNSKSTTLDSTIPAAPKVSTPGYQQLERKVWDYALLRSKEIHTDLTPHTDRDVMIVAQVIYKKCMDYEIHKGVDKMLDDFN